MKEIVNLKNGQTIEVQDFLPLLKIVSGSLCPQIINAFAAHLMVNNISLGYQLAKASFELVLTRGLIIVARQYNIFLPIVNEQNEWVLLVIDAKENNNILVSILNPFKDGDHLNVDLALYTIHYNLGPYKLSYADIATLDNYSDSGVYILWYMEMLLTKKDPLTESQFNALNYRYKIALDIYAE